MHLALNSGLLHCSQEPGADAPAPIVRKNKDMLYVDDSALAKVGGEGDKANDFALHIESNEQFGFFEVFFPRGRRRKVELFCNV